jgi:hypothetical protein
LKPILETEDAGFIGGIEVGLENQIGKSFIGILLW